MSAPMKMRRTSQVAISISNKRFMVPAPRAAAILELVREYQVEENVPADEVLRDVHEKYGKTGSVIRGFRAREDMTQIELANKLGVTQGDLSKMENGKRPVGKVMAHRLGK
ncbi:MAG: helix-turn-helix domain protein, partial [Firmicutes bacterium]|nr:helix-turn-helix domain protein [Bacillota bacterium]